MRSGVRKCLCHRFGHQQADSPEEPGAADLPGHLDQRAAEQLTGSTRMFARVTGAVRETSRIVTSRGVDLRRYRGELLAYRLSISSGVKRLEKVTPRRSHPNDAPTTTSLLIVRGATGLPSGRRIGDIRHAPRDVDAPHAPITKCRYCTRSC